MFLVSFYLSQGSFHHYVMSKNRICNSLSSHNQNSECECVSSKTIDLCENVTNILLGKRQQFFFAYDFHKETVASAIKAHWL